MVRNSMNMATNTSDFEVDELLEDNFIFSDSLIASTELILNDESSMPTLFLKKILINL